MTKPILLTVLVLGIMALVPRPAPASIDVARQRLFALIEELRGRYTSLRDRSEYGVGTLEQTQTAIFRERFEAGTTYLIVAVGCDTAEDIDIAVVDQEGNVVAADTDDTTSSAVAFEPTYTGRFVVAVNMASTTNGDAAHYGYQVFYVDRPR